MAPVRLLELRNTYKWGGGPDKTILLSAARHDPSRVSVVVAYVRDANDHEFKIAEKAHALGLTFYEIEERGKFDLACFTSHPGHHHSSMISTSFIPTIIKATYLPI